MSVTGDVLIYLRRMVKAKKGSGTSKRYKGSPSSEEFHSLRMTFTVFVACLLTGSITVKTQDHSGLELFGLFANSVLALDVFAFVGQPSTSAQRQQLEGV
ncbi:hypothetical protein M405DRAFT_934346 [Rhizopogon salebrosus TDB-379]|nr:hypothetical protein M405DRAFT_934346 [Rhizopogon salebrosus TDB-379]